MRTLSLIVTIDNCQLISIESVEILQRLTLYTHHKEVCLHRECVHNASFDNIHATYHM